jgi:hypothetical protein
MTCGTGTALAANPVRNKAAFDSVYSQVRENAVTPAREFLLDQARALRQLALIAGAEASEKLKALANEYEKKVLDDKVVLPRTH